MKRIYLSDAEIELLLKDTSFYNADDLQPSSYDFGLRLPKQGLTLKKGRVYNLPADIDLSTIKISAIENDVYFDVASKSTPARLDLLVVPYTHDGKLYLSLKSRSFDIHIDSDSKLAQIKFYIVGNILNTRAKPLFVNTNDGNIGFTSKQDARFTINYNDNYTDQKFSCYDKLFLSYVNAIVFKPGQFYLVQTKPIFMSGGRCGEISDFNQKSLDGQVHTAGFIDPGFNGSIVLEIRVLSESLFDLNDPIAFYTEYGLTTSADKAYCHSRNNYQNQKIGLPKQFI